MRYVLVALAIVVGCKSAPSAPPANKVATPDYRATAEDVLGFLPADADLVIGVELVPLRASALWAAFKPQIDAFARELEQQFGKCGGNPIETTERMTFALKIQATGKLSGVIVWKGLDAPGMVQCFVDETNRTGKGKARLDRGVGLADYPGTSGVQAAVAAAGASTVVMQMDVVASYDTVSAILASGAPLRSSPTFMKLFDRREPGAAVWGSANGNAPMFAELARSGMRPTSVDGTLRVTDRFIVALRIGMPSPADAGRVAGELDKVKPMVSTMVERFDTRVATETVAVDVVMTEQQVRNLVGMMAGMLGGF